ncbi:hypothetical protein BC831DRAFT_217 [Entophlyctis helioformis]|nr:hypothetical protein BC831DRAFT_217 [Entophlyctis helioformis]
MRCRNTLPIRLRLAGRLTDWLSTQCLATRLAAASRIQITRASTTIRSTLATHRTALSIPSSRAAASVGLVPARPATTPLRLPKCARTPLAQRHIGRKVCRRQLHNPVDRRPRTAVGRHQDRA